MLPGGLFGWWGIIWIKEARNNEVLYYILDRYSVHNSCVVSAIAVEVPSVLCIGRRYRIYVTLPLTPYSSLPWSKFPWSMGLRPVTTEPICPRPSFLTGVVGQGQPSVGREGTNRVRWLVSKSQCFLPTSPV